MKTGLAGTETIKSFSGKHQELRAEQFLADTLELWNIISRGIGTNLNTQKTTLMTHLSSHNKIFVAMSAEHAIVSQKDNGNSPPE